MSLSIERLINRAFDGIAGIVHHPQRIGTVIIGAGYGPRLLARELSKTGTPVTIIDSDEKLCRLAALTLPHVQVLHGELTDADWLKQINPNRWARVFVATSSDELTLEVCKLVEMVLNPDRLIARVNEQQNTADFELLGYEVMSLPRAALTLGERLELTEEMIQQLSELEEDECLGEVSVCSPVNLGRKLVEIPLDGCELLDLTRQGQSIRITETTQLQIGDLLRLFGPKSAIRSVEARMNAEC